MNTSKLVFYLNLNYRMMNQLFDDFMLVIAFNTALIESVAYTLKLSVGAYL